MASLSIFSLPFPNLVGLFGKHRLGLASTVYTTHTHPYYTLFSFLIRSLPPQRFLLLFLHLFLTISPFEVGAFGLASTPATRPYSTLFPLLFFFYFIVFFFSYSYFPYLRLGRLEEIGLAWPPPHPHTPSSQFLIAQRTATTTDQIAQKQ